METKMESNMDLKAFTSRFYADGDIVHPYDVFEFFCICKKIKIGHERTFWSLHLHYA